MGREEEVFVRVLVTWAHPESPNLGVRALAAGLRSILESAFDRPTIDFQDPGAAFGPRDVLRDVVRASPIRSRISEYDLVIDSGGGDSFTDIYGLKRLITIAYAQRAAARVGVPTVLSPQTIGPFTNPVGLRVARGSIKQAKLVLVRDSVSESVARSMGVDPVIATDVVFAIDDLPAISERTGADLLLNVSGLLWSGNSHVDSSRYQAWTRELIVGVSALGVRVELLAHVLDNPSIDNDVPAVLRLADEFGLEAHVPDGLSSARRVIASSRVLVGARMHACLNALSLGVPAIPWAYSRKFDPLMNDLGWSHTVDLHGATVSPVPQTVRSVSDALAGVVVAGHVRAAGRAKIVRAKEAILSVAP
tara:strand:- start:966 stop:2054 length:1089 start_codon:yes stop_codon:yes gene_type:complete